MEELADLPEEQAVAAHLDDLAWARLSIWARLALFGLFAWFVIVSEDPFSWLRLLPVASLLLFTAYFLARRRVFDANRLASLNNHLPAFERCGPIAVGVR